MYRMYGSRTTQEQLSRSGSFGEMTWAQRLKREFNIDITICNRCGGEVKITAPALPRQLLLALLYYRTSFYEVPVVNPLPWLIHDHLNYHHKFLESVLLLHNSVAWFLSSRLAIYGREPPSIRAGSSPVT